MGNALGDFRNEEDFLRQMAQEYDEMHDIQLQLKKDEPDKIDTAPEHVGNESEYTRFVLSRLKEHKQTTESQLVRQILSRILNHDVRTSYRRFSKYGKNDKRNSPSNRLRGRGSRSSAELPSVQKLVEQRESQKVGSTSSCYASVVLLVADDIV